MEKRDEKVIIRLSKKDLHMIRKVDIIFYKVSRNSLVDFWD
jgi:hypothetical protein